MKVEVMGREVIKPSSLAPQDRLQLSLLDISMPASYVPTNFFYKALAGESSEMVSRRLKSSLSKTLTRFYPFAGRVEGAYIKCNDEGAVFTEARTDLLLSDYLKSNLDIDSLGEFLPQIAPEESAGTWPLLRVQVTFFGSGSGFVVTVVTSHRIADVASLLIFAQAWATSAKSGSCGVAAPEFAGATIYPAPHSSFTQSPPSREPRGKKYVGNRFVFKSSKISGLKGKAVSESVQVPTRVEVITSLLWRCVRNASRSKRSTLAGQAMDLRLRIPSDVLSPSAIGNLQLLFTLKKDAESEMEIGEIVAGFRKSKDDVIQMIKESLQGGHNTTTLGMNLLRMLGTVNADLRSGVDSHITTSWCRKPFYEVDFGWGTPVWVGAASHNSSKNVASAMLMDSKDGEDVEAFVVLPEQDMSVLIHDQDLLTYAVLNPPVLI